MKDFFQKIKTWKVKGDFGISPVFILAALFIFSSVFFISHTFAESEEDTIAPRTPQDLEVKSKMNGFDITWRPNSESDISTYLLHLRSGDERKDLAPIKTGDVNQYSIDNLTPEATYYISLAAKDNSGNVSAQTAEIGLSPDLAQSEKEYSVAGWMPITDLESSHKTFEDNIELFDFISPHERKLEADGSVTRVGKSFDSGLMEKAAINKVKVLPTITNNFDKEDVGSNVLSDEALVANHIENIVNLVEEGNYDGIDIDYEGLKPEVKDQFTGFVQKLAENLHSRGKILSVTVQAKKDDNNNWRGPGAMDYEELGKVVDRFRVMTYDYSRLNTRPGAIAPIGWFQDVLRYTKRYIPQNKIVAGIPTYAYRWCLEDKLNCEQKGLVYEGVENIISKYGVTPEWNSENKAPWLLYIDELENKYAVNYENHESLKAKLKVVQEEEIAGISIWRLGSEDPDNYKVLEQMTGKQIATPKNIVVKPGDQQINIALKKEDKDKLQGYRIKVTPKDENDANSKVSKTNRLKDKVNTEDLEKESIEPGLAEENSELDKDETQIDPYFKEELYEETKEQTFDLLEKDNYTINNLKNDQPYYVSIIPLTWNTKGDYGYQENTENTKLILSTPSDLAYPGTITDLKVEEVANTTADISFSASGDDFFEGQAEKYEIRYSEELFTKDTFQNAKVYAEVPKPEDAKEKQLWQIRELEPGVKYYVGIRSFDENDNPSDISNIVAVETIDNIPPEKPETPKTTASDQSIYINWNKSPEKDLAGYKLYWQQEKSYFQIINFEKDQEDYLLENLENNYTYNFIIQAIDDKGNESAKSEIVSATPKSSNVLSRTNTQAQITREKLKANISIFSKQLFSQGAVPYLVMFSVIIINVIIYHSVKREVQKKIDKNINKSLNKDIARPKKRMDEVRKINRKVLKF
ncbi:MAG: fibronectin type III domain-containing protein [Parcubacteria group bacterium]|nr:fibronectin type III domain-containing protein [Parcubacteria group bacterium]